MGVEDVCSILLSARSCCYIGDVDLDFSVASFP